MEVPPQLRDTFARAALAGFACFAMAGLVGAVAPSFLAPFVGLSSPALAGAMVFALFIASAVGQLAVGRIPASLAAGCVGILAAAGLVAAALALESLALLLAGAIVAGLGQGLSVGGGIDALNAQAPDERRGAIASSLFVVLYLGLAIPIVGVGWARRRSACAPRA